MDEAIDPIKIVKLTMGKTFVMKCLLEERLISLYKHDIPAISAPLHSLKF